MMSIVDSVKNLIFAPKAEWSAIDREPGDVPYLFTNYVAILAAIPTICGFIGMSIIGLQVPGVGTIRMSIASGLLYAIIFYLLAFATVYVIALVVDALAPTFSARKNFESALKLVVYCFTPAWLAGVFLLLPALGFLVLIVGLFGLYLLWMGLPILMKSPPDKLIPYAAAVSIAAIIIYIIFIQIQGAIVGSPQMV